ncbi:MAG: hypothetical protein HZB82_05115 [Deltaproteobacteria bacterium]|nr:hypothetical protein [Deltaproteobacteria bacterium]
MNTKELAEFLLTSLHDAAEAEGYDKIFYLKDFAKKVGIEDLIRISNAAMILKSRGFIQNAYSTPQNLDKGIWCKIACH